MGVGLPDRLTRGGPAPKPGILHLGPGAFFRAFVAQYTHDAMTSDSGDWGIIAASLRSPTARDQLEPQGGTYTAATLTPEGPKTRQIGSVIKAVVATDDPAGLVRQMAEPAIRIVTLTVTEKGYCLDPSTGRLNLSHPGIAHDLSNPQAPQTAPGFILAGLAARRAAGIEPFTVLSCDNLPSNGSLTRAIICDLAREVDAALAAWIEETVAFPDTMVDRITPATTPQDIDRFEGILGYRDEALVVHEPFSQWVIEDHFPLGRPKWEAAGAQFVGSVEAHETMKLRMLNGTHSTLAYLGYLAGHQTIADAVADPPFAALCKTLWRDEIIPTVPQPEGEDLPAYAEALMTRYKDPSIRHKTWQIAMDGSQKLPQRLLGTIEDNLAMGVVPKGLCLAVAGWMRYVGAMDEKGQAIDVRDPIADRLAAELQSAGAPAAKVAALLSVREVFDKVLAKNSDFRAAVTTAYEGLVAHGARKMVAQFVARSHQAMDPD